MKILVLDDHHEFRAEIVGILSRNGYEAQGIATADEAVPLIESGDFDFVLVDYVMPEHDGLWFMKHVHLPKNTKAILVTAHVNRQIIDEMFRCGVAGYIIKPFDETDLLWNLEFHIERSGNPKPQS